MIYYDLAVVSGLVSDLWLNLSYSVCTDSIQSDVAQIEFAKIIFVSDEKQGSHDAVSFIEIEIEIL